MNQNSVRNIVVIVLFALLLTIPIIRVDTVGGKISESEQRTLAVFPPLKDLNTGAWNPNFYPEFETWLNDNIGWREEMNQLNSNIAYSIFKESPDRRVKICNNGWMFWMDDGNFDIAFDKYPLQEDDYQLLANVQKEIRDSLATRGIDYFLMLHPSKVSVYPEKIHPLLGVIKTPVDYLEEKAAANGVKVINTKHSLLVAKDSLPLYLKTDPHWRGEGWYTGYRQVLDSLRAYGYAQNEIDTVAKPFLWYGDLTRVIKVPEKERVLRIEPAHPQAVLQENITDLLKVTDSLYTKNILYWRNSCYIYHKEMPIQQKILLFGDSFMGTLMNPLLREHFSDFVFVWCDKFNLAVVDLVKPDLVIVERTERFIQAMNKSIDDRSCYCGNCP